MLALLIAVPLSAGFAAPAFAEGEYLQITKSVDKSELAPGDVFTYRVQVTCSEESCENATLSDPLPAELDGFALQLVQFAPASIAHSATWTTNAGTSTSAPAELDDATTVQIAFQQPIGAGQTAGLGLAAGETFTMSLTLAVPADYPPGNSGPIVNTATTEANNAFSKIDTATIVIDSEVVVDVSVTKTWSPPTAAFAVDAVSSIALGATNTSNVSASTLVVQEPKTADDGAVSLHESNPFTITEFTGFTATAPTGCVTSQVDAYVLNGGSWSWQAGDPETPPAMELPDGVTNEEVGGIRVTCTGDLPVSAEMQVQLGLSQRAGLTFGEYRVDNVASGRVEVAGQDPATDEDAASHVISPLEPTVEALKSITPERIAAGESAEALIGATNGAIPVDSLTLADQNFFDEHVTFNGWVGGINYPDGATSGTVVYTLLAGGTQSEAFDSGDTPTAPAAAISGFELRFVGNIVAAATVNATFEIGSDEDATGVALQRSLTNRATASVVDSNGQDADNTDSDGLVIVAPGIEATLTKQVIPSTPVEPGESVYVTLEANAKAITDTSTVHDIVIEDIWNDDADGFWNAFALEALAPTQVPAEASLKIEVFNGTAWVEVSNYPQEASVHVVQLTAAELSAALAAATPPVTIDDATGIRFSFHDANGFAQDITVRPLVIFTAQDDLRDGSPTTPAFEQSTTYVNSATVTAEGVSDGNTDLADGDVDTASGAIVTTPGGPGPVGIDKQWLSGTVNAQSGDRASTRLSWSVASGFESVVITDPHDDFNLVDDTVFDAFNLVSVSAIPASSTPFSNGWFLRYDTIVAIERWSASAVTPGWVPVAPPTAGWNPNGAFAGLNFDAVQQADTQGIRLTLAENVVARTAALVPGGTFDAFAPAVGSGVGFGAVDRDFTLRWELRDKKRSGNEWVTGDAFYNLTNAGLVNNSTAIDATSISTGAVSRDIADDSIRILEQPPVVAVTKSATTNGALTNDDVFVPPVGTPEADYPTVSWSVLAENGSASPASFLRVTDPATCAPTAQADCRMADPNANPFATGVDWLTNSGAAANPFDRLDLTGVSFSASIPSQVSLSDSVVWLLRYDSANGTATAEETNAAVVAALPADDLANVIGVSVTFQPADAGGDVNDAGGTITNANDLRITFDSVLRPTIRSTGAAQGLRAGETVELPNRAFAQSYDPVLSPTIATGAVGNARVVLTGGIINITPTKSVSPDEILIANPDVPVTVTLGANQGTSPRSTLSPSVVTIEDQAESPEFWNTFNFTGLGTVVRPAGATQVQVDAFGPFGAGGALAWAEGTPSSTATMPVGAASYSDVQGIRFIFTNGSGGAFFSPIVPAPNWSTTAAFTAELRETYRDSGNEVVFAGSVSNTQTSIATRTDLNNSEAKESAEIVRLDLGTRELSVNKLTNGGNRAAAVGENVPFRLTVQNTGTGYLTLETVTDQLPAELIWLGTSEPVYTAAPGGTLGTDVALAMAPDGRTMTFTWPDGGKTMQPGEVFTIDLGLELQPGLASGESAINTMTAQTTEELDRCSNTNAPQQTVTGAWAQDPTTCGTTDDVRPISGPNLFTIKGVKGSFAGASVPGRDDVTCAPSLAATGGAYYRTPCVANSVIGGVDDWVLRAANAGTFTVYDMVIFDQLPTPGDQSLISGADRGSQFRPELVAESIEVTAPAGTNTTVEVTTSPNVCRGTWTNLTAQDPCAQAGESWAAVDASTDWAAVSGIRVSMSFTSLAGGGLVGGQIVDVTYKTRNVLETTDSPLGASVEVPSTDAVAINQHGVKYTDQQAVKKIAPATVGVQLLTGSIEVRKTVAGAAAAYAPDTFTADVACQIGGVELDLGSAATVPLSTANGYSARIDGIPYSVGTPPECTVAESGDAGEFGESTRSISPVGGVIVITEPSTAQDPDVPVAHVATITNEYRYSGLSVTKTVDTEATEGVFGPFTFTVSCLTANGTPVTFDDDALTLLEFELEDGETFTAPADRIPERSECTLTETDEFFADSIAIVGDNTTDNGDGSATIVVGDSVAEIVVTNGYDAGTLTVAKVVDGAGAAAYGAGPFGFAASCTYQGQTLLDSEFELVGGATRSFGVYPVGTECSITETSAGGASQSTIDPTGGTVVIPEAVGAANIGSVTVTATNTFNIGSIEVLKNVLGDGAALYGAGPFTAQVTCTWNREGSLTAIDLAADGVITLSDANGYRAAVDGVIVGAECTVTETDAAGATATALDPANGVVTIPANGAATPVVTISNTFDVTSIGVTKVVQGNLEAAGASGPFEVELRCTWPVNGVDTDVDIPGGATRELSEQNSYEESYELLPVGSVCSITESKTGGADDTAITVLIDGNDRLDAAGVTAEVDLAGTDAPGQARVIVTNAFDDVVLLPRTGADATFIALLTVSLLGGGIVLLLASRKRGLSRHRQV